MCALDPPFHNINLNQQMNQWRTIKITLIEYISLAHFVKTKKRHMDSTTRMYPVVGLPGFFYCFKYRYYFLLEENVCTEKYLKKSCWFHETFIATVIEMTYLIWKD